MAQWYRGADKSLARPGRKQARKNVRDACDFSKIEFFSFLQGKAPKEIHDILTETLACLLPVGAKDLSAPLFVSGYGYIEARTDATQQTNIFWVHIADTFGYIQSDMCVHTFCPFQQHSNPMRTAAGI